MQTFTEQINLNKMTYHCGVCIDVNTSRTAIQGEPKVNSFQQEIIFLKRTKLQREKH